MLIAKIIICILTLGTLIAARLEYEENYEPSVASNILAIIAGILATAFCTLLITANWNLFTIPKILLLATACLYILFKEDNFICIPFWIGVVVTIIAYIICGYLYLGNVDKCETPDVKTTNCTVICANDGSTVSGGVFYVHENSVYKYYYELEDGGIKLATIPADCTTLYFIESGEQAYLETIVTTTYYLNNNEAPATRWFEHSQTYYKLYVPKGSITNVYEFDAE